MQGTHGYEAEGDPPVHPLGSLGCDTKKDVEGDFPCGEQENQGQMGKGNPAASKLKRLYSFDIVWFDADESREHQGHAIQNYQADLSCGRR